MSSSHVPLIERYRARLPFAPGDPLVSLQEGSTPLLRAPILSEMVGTSVRLKLEGANPTGSFKDRGMTCAVSAAVREGAKAVICASTGNTAASAAAYAARAGITCAVIVPDGKIAQGKMAQTLMHGARVISLAGNFDQALDARPRAHRYAPDRARQLGQRVPHRRSEDGRLRAARGSRRGARAAVHPGRQRRQHHLLLARLQRARRGAAAVRLPGRGGGSARARAPRRASRNGRQRDPHRQPRALGGRDGRHDRLARGDPRGGRQRDPRPPTGCWRPAKGSSASPPRRRRWRACSSTGTTAQARSYACSPAAA